MMNIQTIKILPAVALLLTSLICGVAPVMADEVVIVGEVNEEFQIVSGGKIYEVADNEQGNYLVRNFIGTKVKVTGKVTTQGGIKLITVSSFEVLAE